MSRLELPGGSLKAGFHRRESSSSSAGDSGGKLKGMEINLSGKPVMSGTVSLTDVLAEEHSRGEFEIWARDNQLSEQLMHALQSEGILTLEALALLTAPEIAAICSNYGMETPELKKAFARALVRVPKAFLGRISKEATRSRQTLDKFTHIQHECMESYEKCVKDIEVWTSRAVKAIEQRRQELMDECRKGRDQKLSEIKKEELRWRDYTLRLTKGTITQKSLTENDQLTCVEKATKMRRLLRSTVSDDFDNDSLSVNGRLQLDTDNVMDTLHTLFRIDTCERPHPPQIFQSEDLADGSTSPGSPDMGNSPGIKSVAANTVEINWKRPRQKPTAVLIDEFDVEYADMSSLPSVSSLSSPVSGGSGIGGINNWNTVRVEFDEACIPGDPSRFGVILQGLNYDSIVFVRIRARNAYGVSHSSETMKFNTGNMPLPPIPTIQELSVGTAATGESGGVIEMRWQMKFRSWLKRMQALEVAAIAKFIAAHGGRSGKVIKLSELNTSSDRGGLCGMRGSVSTEDSSDDDEKDSLSTRATLARQRSLNLMRKDQKFGITHYRAQYRQIGRDTWRSGPVINAKDTLIVDSADKGAVCLQYSLSKVKIGREYEVRLRARNSSDWGDWSEPKTITMKLTGPQIIRGTIVEHRGHYSKSYGPANMLSDDNSNYASNVNSDFEPHECDWVVIDCGQHYRRLTLLALRQWDDGSDVSSMKVEVCNSDPSSEDTQWFEAKPSPIKPLKSEDMQAFEISGIACVFRYIRVLFEENHGDLEPRARRFVINFIQFHGIPA